MPHDFSEKRALNFVFAVPYGTSLRDSSRVTPPGANKVSPQRPIPIVLVKLGDRVPIRLDKLSAKLNSIQNLFQFIASDQVIKLPKNYDLPPETLPHGFSDEFLFRLVKDSLAGTGYVYGVGITFEILEKIRFNIHDQNAGVGLITINDAQEFNPVGRTLEQYIAYLLICEAFCLAGRTHFEHPERRFCLFDLCLNKKDLHQCLDKPLIDEFCKTDLENVGFTKHDIDVSAEAILKYVRTPKLAHLILELVNHPVTGFLFGGLIVTVLGNLATGLPGPVPAIILATLVVLLGLTLFVRYRNMTSGKKD